MFYAVPQLGPSIGRELWRERGPTEIELLHIKTERRQRGSQQEGHAAATPPDKPTEASLGIRQFRLMELISSVGETVDGWLSSSEAFWMPSMASRRLIWYQTDLYWLHKHQLHFKEQVGFMK